MPKSAVSRHFTSRFRRSRRENLPISISILSLLALFVLVTVLTHDTRSESLSTTARQGVPSFLLPTSVRAAGYSANFCEGTTPTNFLRSTNRAWLAFLLPAIVFTFIGLALVTDDYFVPSLKRICDCLYLSPDVAGATFMAAGSSAPELFTSMLSVFFTEDDVGIGTIVGSAVFNILIIIGLSAILAKRTLRLDFRPLLRDSFFYIVSVVALLVFVLFSTRGRADWWEGLILLVGYALYILFMSFGNAPYFEYTKQWASQMNVASSQGDVECGMSCFKKNTESNNSPNADTQNTEQGEPEMLDDNPEVEVPLEDEESTPSFFLGVELPVTTLGWITLPLVFPWQFLFRWTIFKCDTNKTKKRWPLTFATSIVWIMAISYGMVEAARLAGCFIGIPSSVMGLTILAAGTSVPDALASVSVARAGFGDMAVSNAIGSNVFDILVGLGLPWFIGGLAKRKAQAITVDPVGLVVIPIVILFGIIIALVSMLALLKWKLTKKVGFALFTMYAAFLTYSLLDVYVLKIGGS